MLIRSRALVALLTLLAFGPGLALAADLDDDDKKWLDGVRPLLVGDEEKVFKDLEEKADRDEFRVIFWARRDPDLSTPENEYQLEYETLRAKADKDFRVPGKKGSETDCGKTLILFGEPDDSEIQVGGVSVLSRVPEVWIYRSKEGGRTFEGGEARISFDGSCRAPAGIRGVLEDIAAEKIVQPQLTYKAGEDGRLVTLEDQLPKDTPARALLNTPREDFALAADTRFLRLPDGDSAVIGVIQGTAADLPVETVDGVKIARIVVTTSALDEAGVEVSWTEQPVRAEVQADGSFLATYGTSLKAGSYTLNVGAVIGESETPPGSLVSHKIDVPDFSGMETLPDGTERKLPSVASILFVRDIQEVAPGEEDPEHAYAAYRLGGTQLIPYEGRELDKDDKPVFFYLIYDLGVDPSNEKADSIVAFSILKGGRTPVAQAPKVPVDTPIMASTVGPVPLETFRPGEYAVQIKVTDNVTGKTVIKKEDFTIRAPEAPAP